MGPYSNHLSILVTLSLFFLSCTDQKYYPNELGSQSRQGTSPRNGAIMDSTIAGIPQVVGSEWVYDNSYSLSSSVWYHDTIRIRLADIVWVTANGSRFVYQEINRYLTDTVYLFVEGNAMYSTQDQMIGDWWGQYLYYIFPLTVGKYWYNPYARFGISSSEVLKRETITVKAGKFDTYVIANYDYGRPTFADSSERWYAPRIGIVNISGSASGILGNVGIYFQYHTELLSFHIGPNRR